MLIDLDPQVGASKLLSYNNSSSFTIYELLHDQALSPGADPMFDYSKAILTNPDGIEFVPSRIELVAFEQLLSYVDAPKMVLNKLLESEPFCNYEYIVLDCGPTFGMLQSNAWLASTYVVVPVEAKYESLESLDNFFKHLNTLRKGNPNLKVDKILITKYKKNTTASKEVEEYIKKHFSDQYTTIKTNDYSEVTNARREGLILSLIKNSKVGSVYEEFTDLVMTEIEGGTNNA